MSTPNTYPLVFDCYHCGKKNSYPDQLRDENDRDTAPSILKRCLNCAKLNKVKIPEGWETTGQDTVYRGHTPD